MAWFGPAVAPPVPMGIIKIKVAMDRSESCALFAETCSGFFNILTAFQRIAGLSSTPGRPL